MSNFAQSTDHKDPSSINLLGHPYMIKVLALELLGVELAITELNLNVGGIPERKGVLHKGGLGVTKKLFIFAPEGS